MNNLYTCADVYQRNIGNDGVDQKVTKIIYPQQQLFKNKLVCNLTTVENKSKDMQNVEW